MSYFMEEFLKLTSGEQIAILVIIFIGLFAWAYLMLKE